MTESHRIPKIISNHWVLGELSLFMGGSVSIKNGYVDLNLDSFNDNFHFRHIWSGKKRTEKLTCNPKIGGLYMFLLVLKQGYFQVPAGSFSGGVAAFGRFTVDGGG